VIFQHPLAYLIGMEGVALLRAWGGEFDEQFVRARLDEVRQMIADPTLTNHPGVLVEPNATGNAYRQWAESYDDPTNNLLELDLPFVDSVLDDLPSGVAVDVACGTGRLAQRMAARGHRVLGVDASLEMVTQARAKTPGVGFVLGDMHKLPLPDASVDLVTNALAMTHVPSPRPVLAEWARVLRPGGSVIISDVHPQLAFLGSVPKAQGPAGRAQLAASCPHSVASYLQAVLSAGLRIRRFAELPRPLPAPTGPPPQPVHEVGQWRDWPWSMLGWAPAAARAVWRIPSMLVWHLERPEERNR
jgi:ubiquinone/menaquinone biosynthesis C-methylase UbiE